jgi:hypothetical protein
LPIVAEKYISLNIQQAAHGMVFAKKITISSTGTK